MKAEDVLAKWTEKTGGAAWKNVHNRVMNGTAETPLLHLKGPVTSYAAEPGNRYDVWEPTPGQPIERGCDGSVAWETEAGGIAKALEGKMKSAAVLDAAFNIELRWPELYAKVETQAVKSVKCLPVGDQPETKRSCYELKMTPKDPDCDTENWYIDTENFQRIGTSILTPAGQVKRMRLYADYRPVNGVLEPFLACEQVDIQKQIIVYKSIQHNVRMSKYRFDLPESVKKQIAEPHKTGTGTAPTTQPMEAPDKSANRLPAPSATPLPIKPEQR